MLPVRAGFGVTTVASTINRPNAAIVSASASASPLVATMTGSTTIGTSRPASTSATACAVSADPIIPILTASTPISVTTELICASTISVGTGSTACTPKVFCAVIAVIAVMAWPPSIVTVLISAWMPAPPPESLPAMIRMRGVILAANVPNVRSGHGVRLEPGNSRRQHAASCHAAPSVGKRYPRLRACG